MNALIDLINDVLVARSPSGSNISTEVSKTLKYVGMIQVLYCTLENLDLDHPECVHLYSMSVSDLNVGHIRLTFVFVAIWRMV